MKVLILEDMPDQAFVVSKMLKHMGIYSTICLDPFEAIEMVRRKEVDVVVTDIGMPVMDGIEFTKRVREFSDIPIIAVTCYVEEYDKERCFKAGISYFLAKPILIYDLKRIFSQW